MGGYFLHESGELVADLAEQHPSLRRVGVCGNRQVYEVRPRLPEVEIRLLGYVNVLVWALAEEVSADLQLSSRLFEGILRHGAGRYRLQSGISAQVIGQLAEVVSGNLVVGDIVSQFDLV